jgi:sorbitol-specific phosphotransferase system component IIBC
MGPLAAAFWGTLTFMLIVQALALIPIFGPTLAMIVGVVAIGAVLLTRFGTQTFIPTLDPELPEVEI